jgi:hypothetical protein
MMRLGIRSDVTGVMLCVLRWMFLVLKSYRLRAALCSWKAPLSCPAYEEANSGRHTGVNKGARGRHSPQEQPPEEVGDGPNLTRHVRSMVSDNLGEFGVTSTEDSFENDLPLFKVAVGLLLGVSEAKAMGVKDAHCLSRRG